MNSSDYEFFLFNEQNEITGSQSLAHITDKIKIDAVFNTYANVLNKNIQYVTNTAHTFDIGTRQAAMIKIPELHRYMILLAPAKINFLENPLVFIVFILLLIVILMVFVIMNVFVRLKILKPLESLNKTRNIWSRIFRCSR